MKSIRFFKGLSWLIFLNIMVKPVWLFFIDRQVQISVGYEQYGKYFAILNLSYVLFFLSDVGISNMLNQRLANNKPVNVLQLLQIKSVLLGVYFIVFCFFGWLTHISDWTILFYVVVIQCLISLLIFFRSIITANQYFVADSLLSVVDKTLMILLCGSILYTSFLGSISLRIFLQIQIACTATAVVVSLWFILKKMLMVRAATESLINIIKPVLPFASIILLMSIHYRVDGFLLERMHPNGAMEAGIYASAYRLLDAGNIAGYLATSFLVAFVARNGEDKRTLEDAVFNTRHLLMFGSVGIVSFVLMFAPWITELLYHSFRKYDSVVFKLCLASLPGYCLVHIYGSLLTGSARFTQFIKILGVSVLFNVILNLALIPSVGALGCCIAALVSQYFCGIATFISATKALNISFNSKSILIYFLFAVVLSLFFYFGKTVSINVWVILGTGIVASLLLLFTQLTLFKKFFISPR
jgi:O-antigen/teichoic acid export membrane protein